MGARAADARVLIASNRGPVSFRLTDDGELSAMRGGGGLVSGLSSVADHPNSLWVCAALSDADRAAARQAPQGRLDLAGHDTPSAVQMLDIPPDIYRQAYNSVANSTLWFISHLLYDTPNQPQFGAGFAAEWKAYRAYNTAFARALAHGAGEDQVRVLVQDYHLALVPGMLARLRPKASTAPDSKPGKASGNVTVRNTSQPGAPRLAAAPSRSRSMAS